MFLQKIKCKYLACLANRQVIKVMLFLTLGVLGNLHESKSQVSNGTQADTTKTKRYSFVPLPLVYFTPETRWGFGAGAFLSFRFKKQGQEVPPSQLQFGIAYTLEKQFLSYLPFQLFLDKGKVKIYGELGYFRYVYPYFGIGGESLEADKEFYFVNFPRLRLNALYRIHPQVFVGLRFFSDDYKIQSLEPDGLLDRGNDLGKEGGLVSALGVVANYDSRDDIFYPKQGSLIEISYLPTSKKIGSAFEYQKIFLDASHFFSLGKNHIIAINGYSEFTFGDAPFNQLALLGGTKRMRGFLEGRFRDDHLLTFQSEYRFPLFWKIKGTLFSSLGSVGSQEEGFSPAVFAYGLGLRIGISKTEKANLRLDYGFGKNTSGFYLTFGEAF